MVQKQGGFPVFELTITEAKANAPLDISVPDSVRQAVPPPVRVTTEKLADGVWYLTGGSHHSVLVEFADHVALIEAPQNEERSTAVIAEVKKLTPTKPIRYLVNTHHHFDHSGGLRTYVAEGATIVTHKVIRRSISRPSRLPRKLNPDRQARTKKKAKIIAIDAKHVLSDGTRTLEIHHIQGNPHNSGILMAWLPKEKDAGGGGCLYAVGAERITTSDSEPRGSESLREHSAAEPRREPDRPASRSCGHNRRPQKDDRQVTSSVGAASEQGEQQNSNRGARRRRESSLRTIADALLEPAGHPGRYRAKHSLRLRVSAVASPGISERSLH